MNTSCDVETRDAVLTAVHAAGFFPSDVQLKAWRRAGLIPRPLEQRGRGKTRGSTTVYPAGTADQLIALGRLQQHERRLEPLAFLLWWQGFPVPLTTIRQVLHRVIDEAERAVSEVIADDELSERGWEELERIEDDPRLPLSLKRARKRTGRFHMSTVGRLLILGAGGAFPGWGETPSGERSDPELMAQAVGVGVLNSVLAAFGSKEQLPHDVEATLHTISASIDPGTLREVLTTSTDRDLETAREELREFATLLGDLLYLAERTPDLLAALRQRGLSTSIDPVSLIGLQVFSPIVEQLAPDWKSMRATDGMYLFLAGLSLSRRPAIRRGLRGLAASSDQLHAVRREAEAFFAYQHESEST